MSSSNYKIDSGFIASYPPPEEVLNLRFEGKTNFVWDPEKSVGVYNVSASKAEVASERKANLMLEWKQK